MPAGSAPRAVPEVLKRRAEFLAAAGRGRKWGAPGLVVQGRERPADEAPGALRVGYTCSKKVGNAVARNRAKRRMRAAAAQVLPRIGRPGWDYVLIGLHAATAARPFAALVTDLETALTQLHAGRGGPAGGPRRGKSHGRGKGAAAPAKRPPT